MSTCTISGRCVFSANLPLEIFQSIVSSVEDHPTLAAISLVSKAFVHHAQAKIFARLDVSGRTFDIIGHLISSPHISQHIHSIVIDYADDDLSKLLGILSTCRNTSGPSRGLKELIISPEDPDYGWSTPLLRSLRTSTLPFLLSLELKWIDAPLFLVTSCTSLQRLRVYQCDLYSESDEEFDQTFRTFDDHLKLEQLGIVPSLESKLMPFLTTLALSKTRYHYPDSPTCHLVKFIQQGNFPALKCLDLSDNEPDWFPLQDIPKLVGPLMNQLVCLAIGYWNAGWNKNDLDQGIDFFRIDHYPNLIYFSAGVQSNPAVAHEAESHELSRRLNWLLDSADFSQHTLKILRLEIGLAWEHVKASKRPENLYSHLRAAWMGLDRGLKENQVLQRLGKLAIPVHPKFHKMRGLLEDSLAMSSAAGKLTFEVTDMEDYFYLS
ncbi:hypothetical protein DL96DRAFT_1648006, partial [Flagelloscypha sp. PMI_526]